MDLIVNTLDFVLGGVGEALATTAQALKGSVQKIAKKPGAVGTATAATGAIVGLGVCAAYLTQKKSDIAPCVSEGEHGKWVGYIENRRSKDRSPHTQLPSP